MTNKVKILSRKKKKGKRKRRKQLKLREERAEQSPKPKSDLCNRKEKREGAGKEGNGRLGDLTHNGKANKSELRATQRSTKRWRVARGGIDVCKSKQMCDKQQKQSLARNKLKETREREREKNEEARKRHE